MITLSIPSSLNELDRVLDFISLGHGITECSIEFWIELLDTVQTIFINIVKYAYPTREGIVKISLNYIAEQQAIEISFFDDGLPYNPLNGLYLFTANKRESMLEGSLGLHLLEKSTEESNYVYLNKKNVTTIKKYVNLGMLGLN